MANEDDAFRRFMEEALPPGAVVRRIDKQAVFAWMERNPDATPEDLRQVLMAPDHDLGEIEGEER
jgi:hypothetical protein